MSTMTGWSFPSRIAWHDTDEKLQPEDETEDYNKTYLMDQRYILADSNILYAKAIDKSMIVFRPMYPNSQS